MAVLEKQILQGGRWRSTAEVSDQGHAASECFKGKYMVTAHHCAVTQNICTEKAALQLHPSTVTKPTSRKAHNAPNTRQSHEHRAT